MAWIGGAVLGWYVGLSVLSTLTVALIWWRIPTARPWTPATSAPPARPLGVIAFAAAAGVCAFALSALINPTVSYDGFAIWTVHPAWYLAGHDVTVSALHNAALVFSHPQYPPLVGGVIALSWRVSGVHTVRLGIVMESCLTGFAVVAASTATMELARRLVPTGSALEDRRGRALTLGAGAVVSVHLAFVPFAAAGRFTTDGHPDLLWAIAAVGAVAYGLVLPWEPAHLGAAVLLVAVAGGTKTEGTLIGAAIVVLIAARGVLVARSTGPPQRWRQPCAYACGTLVVIGAWPILVHFLHALPNVETLGARIGTDQSRLQATLRTAAPHLEIVAVAVPVAYFGAVFLDTRRRASGIGNDLWAWTVLVVALGVIFAAYVTGPGSVNVWLANSVQRTTLFPALTAWWVMGTWAVVVAGAIPRRPGAASGPDGSKRMPVANYDDDVDTELARSDPRLARLLRGSDAAP